MRNGKKKLRKKHPEKIKVIMTQYYNEPSNKTKSEEVSEKYEQRMREKKNRKEVHKKDVVKMKDVGRYYT